MLNFELFLIILVSYLFGSIPFGLLLTKIFLKKDIREIGSGNIGATNALRTGNKLIGYSTLILDVLNLVPNLDFRGVYTTLIEDWMKLDPVPIVGGHFEKPSFI